MIQTNFLLPLSFKMAGRSCIYGPLTIYLVVSLLVAQFLKDPAKLLCKIENLQIQAAVNDSITQTSRISLNFIRSRDLMTSALFKIKLIEDTASFLPNLTIRETILKVKSFKYLVK